MRVEVLTQLLQAKYGHSAYARVLEAVGPNGHRRQAKVEVYYGKGKVYSYTGSILAVAERLNLIPAIDHYGEARRITQELLDAGTAQGYGEVIDSINHLYWTDLTKVVRCRPAHLDDYDRWISTFEVVDNPY